MLRVRSFGLANYRYHAVAKECQLKSRQISILHQLQTSMHHGKFNALRPWYVPYITRLTQTRAAPAPQVESEARSCLDLLYPTV